MLMIFDSNYIGYVSAFAFHKGLSHEGERTEVIYGFLSKIIALYEMFEPEQIAFCWDARSNKRREVFAGYKNRDSNHTAEEKAAIETIHIQFTALREEILPQLGFANVFMQEGYEADDLIARLIMKPKEQQQDIPMVVASDQDLYQLLDYCYLFNAVKKETFNKGAFEREYKIDPRRWVDVKSIAGCHSDHVPGVAKGVGEQTAIKYIKGNLAGKAKATIDAATEKITFNRQLVELPYPGTRRLFLNKNSLSMEKFLQVTEDYGLLSLRRERPINIWQKMLKKLNKGE